MPNSKKVVELNTEEKMDNKSVLGYQQGSPYRGRKSITINTPNGLIDMSNTDIPLLAKDETGMTKMLPPFSGMHRFRGRKVRESRMQYGGDFGDDEEFLFEETDEPMPNTIPVTDAQPGDTNITAEQFIAERHSAFVQQQEEENEIAMLLGMMFSQPERQRKRLAFNESAPVESTGTSASPYRGSAGKYGETFQTFGSYSEGRNALENQLRLYQTGKTRNPVKPSSSLYEAMSVYAPASDNNNPKKYAEFIANKLGISPSTPISQIDTKQWADAIEVMEGNKGRGNNPGNLKRIK